MDDLEHDDEPFDSYFDAAVLLGAWADSTHVHRDGGVFTIDFVRHVRVPADRVLVVRALVAPWVAMNLRDQLDQVWRSYSAWSMPEDGS